MVNKTLCVAAVLALMAGSAQASLQLEKFIDFANEPTADNFKLLVIFQLYSFLIPLLGGPIYVFIHYLWNNYSMSMDFGGTSLTLTGSLLFSFLGFGNEEMLFETFIGLIPNILIRFAITFGLLGETAKIPFGDLEQGFIEQLGLCDMV